MCRIKCEEIKEGLHPTLRRARINTVDGPVFVGADEDLFDEDSIAVVLIKEEGDKALVELPRETDSGIWRIWVPKSGMAVGA